MTPAEQSQLDIIKNTAASLEGIVGVAAWKLEPDNQKPPVLVNEKILFPTASTVKVPLLYELYRQVEEGIHNLSTRLEITPEQLVPGSGILQDFSAGLNPTIRDLAVLMITISDNTATDIILDLVKKEQVVNSMKGLGLEQLEVNLSIRELLYSIAGLDPANPEHTYPLARQNLEDPKHRGAEDCLAYGEVGNDVASPNDLAQLLALIGGGKVLTPAACLDMLDIMFRQKYNTIIPLHLPEGTRVAHKTGSLRGVRNDVGLVYAPSGLYTVAIMTKNLKNEVEVVPKLARLSEMIYHYFSS